MQMSVKNPKFLQGNVNPVQIKAIDLFCGVGGLTHGLTQAGVSVVAGIDVDENCRYPFETNNRAKFIQKDIRKIEGSELKEILGEGCIRMLAGCAPCQPFSTYNRSGLVRADDGKWDLLSDFGRLIRALRPELVTMENVPQLTGQLVFNQFLDSLSGYQIWYDIVECSEYGVPQTRKRLVLLASRLGSVELVPPTHSLDKVLTVRNVLSNLPRLAAGHRNSGDSLHAACSLSEINLRRIRASKPGGTWRDWPVELRAKCHRKQSGSTYPSVYGRMEWDAPAPTITTQCFGFGNGRFGHPEQNRAISLREAALIQTFPQGYKFVPPQEKVRFNVMGRLIGNAVPVRLGKVVGDSLVEHVNALSRTATTGSIRFRQGLSPPNPA